MRISPVLVLLPLLPAVGFWALLPTPYPDRLAEIPTSTTNIDNVGPYDAPEKWAADGSQAGLHLLNPARVAHFDASIRAQLQPPFRVLDAGCGGGLVANALAALGRSSEQESYSVEGVDLSPAALEFARAEARKADLQNVRFQNGSIYALPFADASFDAVVVSDVLEHLTDLPRALRELRRVLRSGGLLLFDTIDRTAATFLVAIVGAERLVGIIQRGSHDWRLFIRPDELGRALMNANFTGFEHQSFEPSVRALGELSLFSFGLLRAKDMAGGEALQRPLLQKIVVQLQQAEAAQPEHLRQPPLPTELPAPLPSGSRRLPPLNRQHSCGAIPQISDHVRLPPKQQVHSAVPGLPLPISELLQQAGSGAIQTSRDQASAASSRSRQRSVSPNGAHEQRHGLPTSAARQRSTSVGYCREDHAIATSRLPRLQLNRCKDDNVQASEFDILSHAPLRPAAAWPSARAAGQQQQSSARRVPQKQIPPPLLQLGRLGDLQSHHGGNRPPAAPRGCPLQSARARSKSAAALPGACKDHVAVFTDKPKGLRNALGPGQVPVGGPALVLPSNSGVAAPPSSHRESALARNPSAPVVLQSARAREKSLFSVRCERQLQNGGVAAPRKLLAAAAGA